MSFSDSSINFLLDITIKDNTNTDNISLCVQLVCMKQVSLYFWVTTKIKLWVFPETRLVVKIPWVPLVVLVAAIFSRRLLPLGVVSHVMLKNAGERHSRQHAHHRSQCQHEPHHYSGKVHGTDGVQGHWAGREKRKEDKKSFEAKQKGQMRINKVWM